MIPEQATQCPSLSQRDRHERLAGVTGMDAHDKDHVALVQHRADACNRRAWADRDGRSATKGTNLPEEAPVIASCLGVDRETIGTRSREGFQESLGLFHHEVDIKGHRGERLPQRTAHRWPHAQVGNQVAVHDIDMDEVGAGSKGVARV